MSAEQPSRVGSLTLGKCIAAVVAFSFLAGAIGDSIGRGQDSSPSARARKRALICSTTQPRGGL